MKADRIMDALGKVKEDYIMESAQVRKRTELPIFAGSLQRLHWL